MTNVKMKPKAYLERSNLIHSLQPINEIVRMDNSTIIINFCFIMYVFKCFQHLVHATQSHLTLANPRI